MKVATSHLLLLTTTFFSTSTAIRLYFNDSSSSGAIHTLQNTSYTAHYNIFISNGSTLQLTNGASITAPPSVDDGESAIRIDDASFIGVNGTIIGGANFGGIGVTISSSRNNGRQISSDASFGPAMTVYGGDAARKETTQGGDAVQVIQSGSRAIFTGGTVVAGRGCSREVCGVSNDNGNAIKVVMGEVIVKGGMFDGDFYNLQGLIQIYGCVKIEEEDGRLRIKGVLSDGSAIDVAYVGKEEQLEIVYDESVCPLAVVAADEATSGDEFDSFGKNSLMLSVLVSIAASLSIAV